jgi:hypothetical protein
MLEYLMEVQINDSGFMSDITVCLPNGNFFNLFEESLVFCIQEYDETKQILIEAES